MKSLKKNYRNNNLSKKKNKKTSIKGGNLSKKCVVRKSDFSFFNHQQDVIDRFTGKCFGQKGLIVFHNMGTGKTLTTIGVMMNLPLYNNDKEVKRVIFTPPGVDASWIEDLEYPSQVLGDEKNFYNKFTENKKTNNLHNPIFYTFDDLKNNNIEVCKNLNNSIVIFDEAHKLIDFVTKLINSPFESDKEAGFNFLSNIGNNFRVIMLTGTPIQSSLSEIKYLVNLCANEYLITDTVKTSKKTVSVDLEYFEKYQKILQEEIDYQKSFWRKMFSVSKTRYQQIELFKQNSIKILSENALVRTNTRLIATLSILLGTSGYLGYTYLGAELLTTLPASVSLFATSAWASLSSIGLLGFGIAGIVLVAIVAKYLYSNYKATNKAKKLTRILDETETLKRFFEEIMENNDLEKISSYVSFFDVNYLGNYEELVSYPISGETTIIMENENFGFNLSKIYLDENLNTTAKDAIEFVGHGATSGALTYFAGQLLAGSLGGVAATVATYSIPPLAIAAGLVMALGHSRYTYNLRDKEGKYLRNNHVFNYLPSVFGEREIKEDIEIQKSANLVRDNDYTKVEILYDEYQFFLLNKYLYFRDNNSIPNTLNENIIYNKISLISDSFGLDKSGITSKMEQKGEDYERVFSNLSFDLEYFGQNLSYPDYSGNRVYIPIPKKIALEKLLAEASYFRSQLFLSTQLKEIDGFIKINLNKFNVTCNDKNEITNLREEHSFYVDKRNKKNNFLKLTKADISKLIEKVDTDIDKINSLIKKISKVLLIDNNFNYGKTIPDIVESFCDLAPFSNNYHRKLLLQWINEYKHIIIRIKILRYIIPIEKGPFGKGEEITKLNENYKYHNDIKLDKYNFKIEHMTELNKILNFEQFSILNMIVNLNTYNLFGCNKFNRLFDNILNNSEDKIYNRQENHYLPLIYSNFDNYGFQLVSAYLTYKHINHFAIQHNLDSSVKSNLGSISKIPYRCMKSERANLSCADGEEEGLVRPTIEADNMYNLEKLEKFTEKLKKFKEEEKRKAGRTKFCPEEFFINLLKDNDDSYTFVTENSGTYTLLENQNSSELNEHYYCISPLIYKLTLIITDKINLNIIATKIDSSTPYDYGYNYFSNVEPINNEIYAVDRLNFLNKFNIKYPKIDTNNLSSITNEYIYNFNNTSFYNNTPFCILISDKITEGIDFPLSPSIHVLEVPETFGKTYQIYGRVLRVIKKDSEYNFSNLLKEQTEKINSKTQKLFDEIQNLNVEVNNTLKRANSPISEGYYSGNENNSTPNNRSKNSNSAETVLQTDINSILTDTSENYENKLQVIVNSLIKYLKHYENVILEQKDFTVEGISEHHIPKNKHMLISKSVSIIKDIKTRIIPKLLKIKTLSQCQRKEYTRNMFCENINVNKPQKTDQDLDNSENIDYICKKINIYEKLLDFSDDSNYSIINSNQTSNDKLSIEIEEEDMLGLEMLDIANSEENKINIVKNLLERIQKERNIETKYLQFLIKSIDNSIEKMIQDSKLKNYLLQYNQYLNKIYTSYYSGLLPPNIRSKLSEYYQYLDKPTELEITLSNDCDTEYINYNPDQDPIKISFNSFGKKKQHVVTKEELNSKTTSGSKYSLKVTVNDEIPFSIKRCYKKVYQYVTKAYQNIDDINTVVNYSQLRELRLDGEFSSDFKDIADNIQKLKLASEDGGLIINSATSELSQDIFSKLQSLDENADISQIIEAYRNKTSDLTLSDYEKIYFGYTNTNVQIPISEIEEIMNSLEKLEEEALDDNRGNNAAKYQELRQKFGNISQKDFRKFFARLKYKYKTWKPRYSLLKLPSFLYNNYPNSLVMRIYGLKDIPVYERFKEPESQEYIANNVTNYYHTLLNMYMSTHKDVNGIGRDDIEYALDNSRDEIILENNKYKYNYFKKEIKKLINSEKTDLKCGNGVITPIDIEKNNLRIQVDITNNKLKFVFNNKIYSLENITKDRNIKISKFPLTKGENFKVLSRDEGLSMFEVKFDKNLSDDPFFKKCQQSELFKENTVELRGYPYELDLFSNEEKDFIKISGGIPIILQTFFEASKPTEENTRGRIKKLWDMGRVDKSATEDIYKQEKEHLISLFTNENKTVFEKLNIFRKGIYIYECIINLFTTVFDEILTFVNKNAKTDETKELIGDYAHFISQLSRSHYLSNIIHGYLTDSLSETTTDNILFKKKYLKELLSVINNFNTNLEKINNSPDFNTITKLYKQKNSTIFRLNRKYIQLLKMIIDVNKEAIIFFDEYSKYELNISYIHNCSYWKYQSFPERFDINKYCSENADQCICNNFKQTGGSLSLNLENPTYRMLYMQIESKLNELYLTFGIENITQDVLIEFTNTFFEYTKKQAITDSRFSLTREELNQIIDKANINVKNEIDSLNDTFHQDSNKYYGSLDVINNDLIENNYKLVELEIKESITKLKKMDAAHYPFNNSVLVFEPMYWFNFIDSEEFLDEIEQAKDSIISAMEKIKSDKYYICLVDTQTRTIYSYVEGGFYDDNSIDLENPINWHIPDLNDNYYTINIIVTNDIDETLNHEIDESEISMLSDEEKKLCEKPIWARGSFDRNYYCFNSKNDDIYESMNNRYNTNNRVNTSINSVNTPVNSVNTPSNSENTPSNNKNTPVNTSIVNNQDENELENNNNNEVYENAVTSLNNLNGGERNFEVLQSGLWFKVGKGNSSVQIFNDSDDRNGLEVPDKNKLFKTEFFSIFDTITLFNDVNDTSKKYFFIYDKVSKNNFNEISIRIPKETIKPLYGVGYESKDEESIHKIVPYSVTNLNRYSESIITDSSIIEKNNKIYF